MKEKIGAILSLLSLSLIIIAVSTPAVAAPDGIPFRWLEPDYSGTDESLPSHPTIIGYLEGTNWNFTMSWTNTYIYPINVSAIRTYFSWGKNYTYTFTTPIEVDPGQVKIFTINDITPPVNETGELWTHSYNVYIHHVNNTVTPYAEVPNSVFLPSPILVHSGSGFAVLSESHLACLNLWKELNDIFTGGHVPSPDVTEVQVLLQQASMEFNQGTAILETGIFGSARTHLENAESLYNQALAAWDQRGTAKEDAELNSTNANTNYYNALASSSLVNAYGWLFFGLGWTFIGIGVIIYGLKRPKTPQT
jgi:hypothetical protein